MIRDATSTPSKNHRRNKYTIEAWLSKFNQPIILLSSLDGKNKATLVALGNSKINLTWVSADGLASAF